MSGKKAGYGERGGWKNENSLRYKLALPPHLPSPYLSPQICDHNKTKPTLFPLDQELDQVTMQVSIIVTALFTTLAMAAPPPRAVDKLILDFLHDLPAGGPALYKRHVYTHPTLRKWYHVPRLCGRL